MPRITPIVVALLLGLSSLTIRAGTNYSLYVCAGQSNMDGRGKVAELSAPFASNVTNAIIFYQNPPFSSGGWQTFAPGYSAAPNYKGGMPSPTFGPEVGFVHSLRTLHPDRPIAILKVSKGGTAIELWRPGILHHPETQGICYQNMVAAFSAATHALEARGDSFQVRGVLWHQGESNAHTPTPEFEQKLTELIRRMREDFGNPTLAVVLGQVYDNGERKTVIEGIHAVATAVPQVALAGSDGLVTQDKGTHFDAASQLILGDRFARALAEK